MSDLKPLTPEDIRRFRTDSELSRSELAQALGAGLRTIEDWEAGRRRPPPMLRIAFAALARGIRAWKPDPPVGPDASPDDVDFHVAKMLAQRGDDHGENLAEQFSRFLAGGVSPAETLLCARMMDQTDGYNPLEIWEDWESRTQKGWRTNMAFRPDGFELRPTIIAESRHDDAVKPLVVFVDKHRPGERLPAKVRVETALIARGYRILSFSETDVLMNGPACAETVETVINELAEEALLEAGQISSAWKRPDRRGDLPDE
jgi:DNA-binding XRE family transcriptional regulator